MPTNFKNKIPSVSLCSFCFQNFTRTFTRTFSTVFKRQFCSSVHHYVCSV